MIVYEDAAERHRFDYFCKVVLRHEMLTCFRETSYQNKWLVSLHYLPPSALDGICTKTSTPAITSPFQWMAIPCKSVMSS